MAEPSEVIRFDGVRLAFGRNVVLRGGGFPLPRGATLVPLREKLGIVFQEMALFDSLNVYENVAYRLIEDTVHGALELADEEIERRGGGGPRSGWVGEA